MEITSKKNYTLPINTAFAEFLQTRSNDTKKQILQAKGNLEQSGEFDVNPERILTLSANGSKYIVNY